MMPPKRDQRCRLRYLISRSPFPAPVKVIGRRSTDLPNQTLMSVGFDGQHVTLNSPQKPEAFSPLPLRRIISFCPAFLSVSSDLHHSFTTLIRHACAPASLASAEAG